MPSVIRASKIGDAAIIKSIINILANEDIKVISSIYLIQNYLLKKEIIQKISLIRMITTQLKKLKIILIKLIV